MTQIIMGLHKPAGQFEQYIPVKVDAGGNVNTASQGNITAKFREAFEAYDPNTGSKWVETKGSGDLVYVDGNALAASYLVVSKDPLSANTVTEIETVSRFNMPIEVAVGLSMSQRTLGQEFSVEVVSDEETDPVSDLEIASISQATTTLTINTTLPHGLVVGKRIGVKNVSDSRLNYPSLVVATTPSSTQITVTAGPGGNLPSVTAGPFTSGSIYFRSALGLADNGTSMIFENATATNASFYIRSESGDALPSGTAAGSHSLTIATTASVQAVNAAYNYAFQPTTEYRLALMADRLQWSDVAVDAITQSTNRVSRTQVIPSTDAAYKFRIRATNNDSLTVPSAQIVSVSKAGSTTATIIFDRPHGFTTTDVFVAYGVRDQANFANLTSATAVASIVNPTTITAIWGSSATATSYGGYAAKVNGGNLMSALGQGAVVCSNAAVAGQVLTLVGNTNWSGLSIGDLTNAIGLRNSFNGDSLGVDGAYRVQNVVTSVLTLQRVDGGTMPGDFTATDCGGTVIRRTDMRLSFVRVFDFERERVEMLARPTGDIAGAAPVTVQNSPSVTMTSTTVAGTVAVDAAIGNPVTAGLRASNANITAMSASGDSVALLGTMIGVGVFKPYCLPEVEWAYTGALTTTSDVQVQAAAGAGIKRHVTMLQATNTGASAVDVLLRDATTTRLQVTVPAGQSVVLPLPTGVTTTANTVLNAALSAVGTVRVNILGYTAP